MPSPLRLGALAGLLALTACDSAVAPPTPPSFTVAVVANGDTLETADAAPAASFADVPAATVHLAPRRDVPEDPELRRRWESMQVLVAISNAASDNEYEVGHYLIETEADAAGAALVTAPVDCFGEPTLGFGSPWLEAPGAIFFPVLVGAEVGPALTFRAFGLDGTGRFTFEGDGETATVQAPLLDAAPALVSTVISEADVVLRRGTSAAEVAVVARRGADVSGGFAGPDDAQQRLTLPGGDGPAEVFLFEAVDDAEAACPTAEA